MPTSLSKVESKLETYISCEKEKLKLEREKLELDKLRLAVETRKAEALETIAQYMSLQFNN